jgi:hypothetical protein
VLADNKLALNAGWDSEILAIELQALIDLDFDVTLTGFSLAEIDQSFEFHNGFEVIATPAHNAARSTASAKFWNASLCQVTAMRGACRSKTGSNEVGAAVSRLVAHTVRRQASPWRTEPHRRTPDRRVRSATLCPPSYGRMTGTRVSGWPACRPSPTSWSSASAEYRA